MMRIAQDAGGRVINPDRMWHYVEGIHNWDPVWPLHAIRILPGPSSMWFDALGNRLPAPLFPGFDTLGTLAHLRRTGHDHSWFILTHRIIGKEFALSGSEQNPDLTGKSVRDVVGRATSDMPAPVRAFLERGEDFVQADTDRRARAQDERADPRAAPRRRAHRATGRRARPPARQPVRQGRPGDGHPRRARLPRRPADPHREPAPDPGPQGRAAHRGPPLRPHAQDPRRPRDRPPGRVLGEDGRPVPGLYAAGEAAGFGGGGVHGYRSLEGTFLGGCIFSGRTAGRAAAAATA